MEFQIVSLDLGTPDVRLTKEMHKLVEASGVQVTAEFPQGVEVEGDTATVLDLANRLQHQLRRVGNGEVATDASIDSSPTVKDDSKDALRSTDWGNLPHSVRR